MAAGSHHPTKELYYLALAVVAAGEASFRLGVLPGFLLISLHDLLCVTDDGFRSKVSGFLLLGLPILHFWVQSFVWASILSFFVSFSLAKCFSFIITGPPYIGIRNYPIISFIICRYFSLSSFFFGYFGGRTSWTVYLHSYTCRCNKHVHERALLKH